MDYSHRTIVRSTAQWPALYRKEADFLKSMLGTSIVDIQHIGSTSVPQLASKPIIDIMVLAKTRTLVENIVSKLVAGGYEFDKLLHARYPNPERHFLRKGRPTQFHLSVAYPDKGSYWNRQLVFRDYLRSNSEARKSYERLKRTLIQQDPTGGETYIQGKTDFIQQILKQPQEI